MVFTGSDVSTIDNATARVYFEENLASITMVRCNYIDAYV